MKKLSFAILLGLSAAGSVAGPALAQNYEDEQRWRYAQRRYDEESARYQAERDRYYAIRDAARRAPPPGRYPDDRYEGGYDPSRYYRDDPAYRERALASDDRVYRGSDGRYYCKRSDGTTGLIIGAAGGGLLGNVIDGGHSRAAGTLIGAAIGALAGKSIDQNQSEIRCR
jgi:Ni/Co efflux regulator RcnB